MSEGVDKARACLGGCGLLMLVGSSAGAACSYVLSFSADTTNNASASDTFFTWYIHWMVWLGISIVVVVVSFLGRQIATLGLIIASTALKPKEAPTDNLIVTGATIMGVALLGLLIIGLGWMIANNQPKPPKPSKPQQVPVKNTPAPRNINLNR